MKIRSCGLALLLAGSVIGQSRAGDCSESTVDRVDSPGFFHSVGDCGNTGDQSPASTRTEVEGSGTEETTIIAPGAGTSGMATNQTTGAAATKLLTLQGGFQIAGSAVEPDYFDVTLALTRKMAAACSDGWEKKQEWVETIENGYLLNIRFRCLSSSAIVTD